MPLLDAFLDGWDFPMVVVTTVAAGSGERSGCLVGFTTQASIDPARFLVCLSRTNHTYRVAFEATHLAVHRLSATQRNLAELFGTVSGDEVDKFARCRWSTGPGGLPLLDDCPNRFIGLVVERHPYGDHTGFLLEAVSADGDRPASAPLMFSAVGDLEAGHDA